MGVALEFAFLDEEAGASGRSGPMGLRHPPYTMAVRSKAVFPHDLSLLPPDAERFVFELAVRFLSLEASSYAQYRLARIHRFVSVFLSCRLHGVSP